MDYNEVIKSGMDRIIDTARSTERYAFASELIDEFKKVTEDGTKLDYFQILLTIDYVVESRERGAK